MPTIKRLEFADGVTVTAPADPTLDASTKQISVYADETAYVTANGTAQEGDFFFDSTLNVVKVYDGAAWNEVGAGGSGAGELNLVENPSDALLGWTASGAGVTVATSNTSTDLPLAGLIDTSIKITPVSGTTDYVRYRFTMPTALMGRKLKAEWYQRPLSGYASGDLKFDVYVNSASNYSGSYTRVALSTDSSAVTSIPNANGKFAASFDADTNQYYEIRFTRVSGTTALNIANVIVGPGIQPQGAVVSSTEIDANFTFDNFGTVSNKYIYRTTVGSSMNIFGSVQLGTVVASTAAINLPTGFTLDTSKLPTLTNGTVVGYFKVAGTVASDLLSTNQTDGVIFYDGSSTSKLFFAYNGGTTARQFNKMSGSNFGSNQMLTVTITVPISEWAGSGTINLVQNESLYASNSSTADSNDTTSFAYGPAGSSLPGALTASRTRTVRHVAPILSTDMLMIEYQPGGTGQWLPLVGQDPTNLMCPFVSQNGVTYGMRVNQVSGTDCQIVFGQYAFPNGATYGAAGASWASVTASTKYRVRKNAENSAVGFNIVSSTASGLMPSTHTNLDNESATRLGLKAYVHGTTYNGGNAPTVTLASGGGSLSTVNLAQFIPYQMQDGTWRMKFNINVTLSTTSRTSVSLAIAGISTASYSGNGQTISGSNLANVANNYVVMKTGGVTEHAHASASTNEYQYSGDIVLTAKPNWAY